LLPVSLCDMCTTVSVLWECYLHNDLQMCRHQQKQPSFMSVLQFVVCKKSHTY